MMRGWNECTFGEVEWLVVGYKPVEDLQLTCIILSYYLISIILLKTSNSSLKTRGAAAPRTRITWRLC